MKKARADGESTPKREAKPAKKKPKQEVRHLGEGSCESVSFKHLDDLQRQSECTAVTHAACSRLFCRCRVACNCSCLSSHHDSQNATGLPLLLTGIDRW